MDCKQVDDFIGTWLLTGFLNLQKAKAQEANEEITVKVLNDNSERKAIKGVTTSMDIVKEVDKKLQKAALSIELMGQPNQVWDLLRPLEDNCTIKFLTWEDPLGKDVSVPFCLS